jgi:hypothetical protein
MLPGIMGILAGASRIPAGTVIINDNPQEDHTDTNSYTFSIDGGAAQDDRRIWVMIHWEETDPHKTISSVTINGVSASGTQRGHSGGSTGLGAGVYSAVVPTGDGSMNAVVNFSLPARACALDSVVGYGFSTSAHEVLTAENAGTADDLSVSIDTAAGGIIVAAFTGSTNTAEDRVTWTGATELYDADFEIFGIGGSYSGAVQTGTSSASNVTVGITVATQADAGNDLVVETRGLA